MSKVSIVTGGTTGYINLYCPHCLCDSEFSVLRPSDSLDGMICRCRKCGALQSCPFDQWPALP